MAVTATHGSGSSLIYERPQRPAITAVPQHAGFELNDRNGPGVHAALASAADGTMV